MTEFQSSSDFKSDILAVLELNEASYVTGNEEEKEGYFTIACEIRARLLQALSKATHFFENNLELLATIAQLKRESAAQITAQKQAEEVLRGRIESLMDVVQQQQAKLDAQAKVVALKGIWSNLLHTVNRLPSDSAEVENDCSTVISWLSLQCARDASRTVEEHSANAERHGDISLSINDVLEKVTDMHRRSVEVHDQISQENVELRRRLQENAAKRQGERRDLEHRNDEVSRLSSELKQWVQKVKSLEEVCEQKDHKVQSLQEKNAQLHKDVNDYRESASSWREKCLETLNALDVATAALSETSPQQQLRRSDADYRKTPPKSEFTQDYNAPRSDSKSGINASTRDVSYADNISSHLSSFVSTPYSYPANEHAEHPTRTCSTPCSSNKKLHRYNSAASSKKKRCSSSTSPPCIVIPKHGPSDPLPTTPTGDAVVQKHTPSFSGSTSGGTRDKQKSSLPRGEWNSHFASSSKKKYPGKDDSTFGSEHSNRVLEDALSIRSAPANKVNKTHSTAYEATPRSTPLSPNRPTSSLNEPISPIVRIRSSKDCCDGESVVSIPSGSQEEKEGSAISNDANRVAGGEQAGSSIHVVVESKSTPGGDEDLESHFSFSTVTESLEIF